MKKSKILLSLGTVAAIAAPIAATISCGKSEQKVRHFNLLPTYTGQADQLIALGIHADYYPMQLNVKTPYSYLTNPGQFMTQQSDDFKGKFKNAIAGLLPKTQSVSWWNQDALASDDHRVPNTYWQKQEGSVLLYEHYLLDDDSKVIESSWAPKHHAQTALQTNFRASRDPYTRIPKGVFFGWDLADSTLAKLAAGKLVAADIKLEGEGKDAGKEIANDGNFVFKDATTLTATLNKQPVDVDQTSAKIIVAMRDKHKSIGSDGTSDWFYNDWFFVDSFHRTYLDNKDFQSSSFANWMLDSTTTNPFEAVAGDGHTLSKDQASIKQLFDASTFQGDEVKAGLAPSSRAAHHPIYEQQDGVIGAAPMFEGAMRDNQLYLFNVAWQVANLANTGTPYGKQYVDSLPDGSKEDTLANPADFSVARTKYEAEQIKAYVAKSVTPTQLAEMKVALTNANTITGELRTRMDAMKEYFKALKVDGKTFGLMTIAPGKGVSTLQTMSKYSFIYKELGFAQPTPSNLTELGTAAKSFTDAWVTTGAKAGTNPNLNGAGEVDTSDSKIKEAIGKDSIFNMDDNGWFWTLGEAGALKADKLNKFKDSIDLGVIASRPESFKAEVTKNKGIEQTIAGMFKNSGTDAHAFVNKLRGQTTSGNFTADYDLWNEGLKTPFVMDMLLDQIMTKSEEYYLAQAGNTEASLEALQTAANKYTDAKSWGNYFTKTFVTK